MEGPLYGTFCPLLGECHGIIGRVSSLWRLNSIVNNLIGSGGASINTYFYSSFHKAFLVVLSSFAIWSYDQEALCLTTLVCIY